MFTVREVVTKGTLTGRTEMFHDVSGKPAAYSNQYKLGHYLVWVEYDLYNKLPPRVAYVEKA